MPFCEKKILLAEDYTPNLVQFNIAESMIPGQLRG